jgi:hypothetical protein
MSTKVVSVRWFLCGRVPITRTGSHIDSSHVCVCMYACMVDRDCSVQTRASPMVPWLGAEGPGMTRMRFRPP